MQLHLKCENWVNLSHGFGVWNFNVELVVVLCLKCVASEPLFILMWPLHFLYE